ncbi:glutamate-5-semialdehyde dehydrogenase [Aciditerrimonas ferrireducens]|uniref:Gamma-glutamyl phosphate reductase n=1 Tax=Aciditerrimonas ferrireducens TaxID=667306 RepID=A0ABV6C5M7_9ACTN
MRARRVGAEYPGAMAEDLDELGERAVTAARALARARRAAKDAFLTGAAALLEERREEVLAANAQDVAAAETAGADATALDRLRLTPARVAQMAEGLRAVAAQADPVGEVVAGWVLPNGLRVSQVRVPLGVVGVVYENRPNVTADAAALAVKAGNAVVLRGSSAAARSNGQIVELLRLAAAKAGLPEDAVLAVPPGDHETVRAFLQLPVLDCLVPRGGRQLLAAVRQYATVPTIIDGEGNCHVYVDRAADLAMAEAIVVNAKTQRPSVCNAAETLLVHAEVAETFLPRVAAALQGVELVGDERVRRILPGVGPASEEDFAQEFLGPKLAVGVVDDLEQAMAHIARYSTGHSEAIVTEDLRAAERFLAEVDAAAVLVNASTRFVDGGELGLGAEIGISTQKLHVRGPMGLRALTSVKYQIRGEGQVRS